MVNDVLELTTTVTFDSDDWHFVTFGISKFWDDNLRLRVIFDSEQQKDVVSTGFVFTDNASDLTYIGADFAVNLD